MQYLRRQSPEKLLSFDLLLDYLIGLEPNLNSDNSTTWSALIQLAERLELQSVQTILEVGRGIGRLGF